MCEIYVVNFFDEYGDYEFVGDIRFYVVDFVCVLFYDVLLVGFLC